MNDILVPTDLSDGDRAFVTAMKLALAARSTLHVMHVHPPTQPEVHWSNLPTVRALLTRWGLVDSNAGTADYEKLGVRVFLYTLLGTDPAEQVAERARSMNPELLVLCTRGRQAADWFRAGSIAETIARRTGLPALFLGPNAPDLVDADTGAVKLQRVAIPLGGGDAAFHQHTLDSAIPLLEVLSTGPMKITFVHAGRRQDLPDLELPARTDWVWDSEVRQGNPVDVVLDAAKDNDLVVMGTHGHDSLYDFIAGSRTERVLRVASCPVLAIPGQADPIAFKES